MRIEDFVPQVLPASTRSLAGGVPSASPGTIFVLAAEGGFCVQADLHLLGDDAGWTPVAMTGVTR